MKVSEKQTGSQDHQEQAVSRRSVLRRGAVGGLGLVALGVGAACGGDDKSSTAETTAAEPRVQNFSIELGEGQVIEEVDGKDELVGEYHRWEPAVLVAFKDDRIVLQVKNPRKNVHTLEIPAFKVDTGRLEPRTGVKTVEFVADRAGVFAFGCGADFDEAKKVCDPDHKRMVGHLVVLNA